MFLSIFLGAALGHVAGALLVIGYSYFRSKLANRRVDKHVKELVEALQAGATDTSIPVRTTVRIPMPKGGPDGN